eukprot:scaffold70253_cov23-Tisochrysis_lutea.AAC.1
MPNEKQSDLKPVRDNMGNLTTAPNKSRSWGREGGRGARGRILCINQLDACKHSKFSRRIIGVCTGFQCARKPITWSHRFDSQF